MIRSLHIDNYALIDRLDIELGSGLNIITGETGAGKSIILGALGLLLGARAEVRAASKPERKTIVEAVFDISGNQAAYNLLQRDGLVDDDVVVNELILRREIATSGRSRAFVNDTPVNLTVLGELARLLVDIHSQHQNLLLAQPEFQVRIIDALGNNKELLTDYERYYNVYRNTLSEYNSMKKRVEELRHTQDQMSEQLEQIDDLELEDDEQEELEKERDLYANLAHVADSLRFLISNLSDSDETVVDALADCVTEAENVSSFVPEGEELCERLNSAYLEIRDIALSYEEAMADLNADPARQEYVNHRLNVIYRLQKRFNVGTIAELLAKAEQIRADLDLMDTATDKMRSLRNKGQEQRAELLALARKLSEARKNEAQRFIAELQEKAAPLGMKNLRAEVRFSYAAELTATGIDKVEMLFSFNKNREPLPVSNTASGGEISRLMLCIKDLLSSRMQLPTIIFDEIDTGVSGEIANRMGEMMLAIAGKIQVLAITHLPQVAAKGTTHFKVYKEDDEQTTYTRLRMLSPQEREMEIARMLSGAGIDDAALNNARSLLNQ